LELHESFPIQPLTNNLPILKGTIKRFTEGSYLYPNDYPFNDPSPPDINRVVDGQTSRLNKSRWFSANTKTFSPAGLMWAWFTISHNWQGQWGVKSVSEEYFGGSVPDRSLSAGNPLPLADNAKHIVLITDGFDNDGQEAKTGPTATTTGVLEGYYNACDSYMPVTSFVDPDALPSDSDNYQKLCKKIRDEGIRIHIILYGIDVAVDDKRVKKYRACAGNTGDLYINPTPNQLSASFNTIFSKILADGVQVRLIH
jgi:hypothetical protein